MRHFSAELHPYVRSALQRKLPPQDAVGTIVTLHCGLAQCERIYDDFQFCELQELR
jgi:hypothetical protein